MKIHLIDGTYELFRSHFGAPAAKSPTGREVGATRGLLRSLIAMLRDPDVTHLAIAFDHVIESFRNDLFPGYKTSLGIELELLDQFPLAEEVSRSLGIVTWPMIEFEADDALATAANRWSETVEVEQILICSPDKDFAQCVRDARVVLFDRRRDRIYDERGVVEKWGVAPKSIPDYLALVGDAADGIPGVPRWGAKSTAAVLAHFGTIENIPPLASQWNVTIRGAAALAANLKRMRAEVALYKQLATLRLDVPLTESLEDLNWQGPDKQRLAALCDEIGTEVPL